MATANKNQLFVKVNKVGQTGKLIITKKKKKKYTLGAKRRKNMKQRFLKNQQTHNKLGHLDEIDNFPEKCKL